MSIEDYTKLLIAYKNTGAKIIYLTAPKEVLLKRRNDEQSDYEIITNYYEELNKKYDEIMKYSSKFIDVIAINTHETNIADQIEQRIHNLESAVQMENYYNTGSAAAGDDFDTVGYQQLFQNEDDETFDVSLEDKPDAFDED